MSKLSRGHYTLDVIDSTKQFSLEKTFGGEHTISGEQVTQAHDIIQLMRAYIELTRRL
jgi:hypothetical protein